MAGLEVLYRRRRMHHAVTLARGEAPGAGTPDSATARPTPPRHVRLRHGTPDSANGTPDSTTFRSDPCLLVQLPDARATHTVQACPDVGNERQPSSSWSCTIAFATSGSVPVICSLGLTFARVYSRFALSATCRVLAPVAAALPVQGCDQEPCCGSGDDRIRTCEGAQHPLTA
jgi:hypothetical protein